jgi:glyoxylase-like metal-dependent hydrolase (beta-lactamase superfamily II)
MLVKAAPAARRCALALLLMAGTAGFFGQGPKNDRGGEKPDANALHAELVKTGLFVIIGGGGKLACASLLRLSANGFILVDGKLPGNYDAILELARKVSFSEQPIRVLITSDHQVDHTGNNAVFLAAGTQVIAQENVRQNMIHSSPAGAKVPIPSITYDHDYELMLGGVKARLMHFGSAHTSGDTVVLFPDLKVIAIGNLFASVPDPDFSAGGSLVGWGPVLGEILKLDFDFAVPGSGPAVTRADLEAFRKKLDTLVSRAAGLVKKGVRENQLMGQLKTDDLGWRFNFTGSNLHQFYNEISRIH